MAKKRYRKNKMKWIDLLAGWLMIVGAINWGLAGLSFINFDLVQWLGNITVPFVATLLYGLIGLSGVYALVRVIMRKYMK